MRRAVEALDSIAVNSSRELLAAAGASAPISPASKVHSERDFNGGRYRDRTDDLLRVKQTLYH